MVLEQWILLAIAAGFQCACSRAMALDLEAVSMVCVGIGGREGGREDLAKTPSISINMHVLGSILPFQSKSRSKKLVILCSVDLYEEISDAVTSANAKDSGKFCNC